MQSLQVSSLLLATGIAVTTASCGSASPSGPAPGRTGPLECQVRGYPCSLSEVPIAVLERGDALGDEALARLEGGAPTSDVAGFLAGQSDVAEVRWDETGIWFRPKGGTGIWILGKGAFSPESFSGVPPVPSPARIPRTASWVAAGPEAAKKKALVLSPFHWNWPDSDESSAVAAILSGTRGYESGVTYQENAQQSSKNVGPESFMHWNDYQVVHVSSHGTRICHEGQCKAMLIGGVLNNHLPAGPGTKAEKLRALTLEGVTYAKGPKTEYLTLDADFFRAHYPAGLKNTLVFLNACQSFGPQATDLVDAIKGSTSVVFGWTETVDSDDAAAAAVALYDALAERGYPAQVAYDQLGTLKVGTAAPGRSAPTLLLAGRTEGGDLRIREVVYLLNPATGQILTPSDLVEIQGTENDGTPDAAPFLVRIDGVKQELAADMMVHVSIDGKETVPVALASGQRNDEDQWTLSGILPLSYDLKQAAPVQFRAWVNLHDGGESKHESGATLTGSEPIMGFEWQLDAVATAGFTKNIPKTEWSSTTHLTLKFAPGQAVSEPHPRYVVTGGSVKYDDTPSPGVFCTFTATSITFEVTQEISRDSELVFNTTVNPVQYYGSIYTYGPEFEVTADCSGDTSMFTKRANTPWLLLAPDEASAVSSDRRSIAGKYRDYDHFGDFYIESNYTFTRTK